LFEDESRVYKLFISHIDRDEDEYSIFIQKLSGTLEYQNLGTLEKINENDLMEQIKPAEIVIVLSGLYNKYKSTIKKQVDIARNLNKPIIVIRPYGMETVPEELEEIAADIVGWNAPCIAESIEDII
jgi:bifunctional DNA-binding transcriptional regulator/antitoxin component of YhaV-PrlF toxin-antitoxin module